MCFHPFVSNFFFLRLPYFFLLVPRFFCSTKIIFISTNKGTILFLFLRKKIYFHKTYCHATKIKEEERPNTQTITRGIRYSFLKKNNQSKRFLSQVEGKELRTRALHKLPLDIINSSDSYINIKINESPPHKLTWQCPLCLRAPTAKTKNK